MMQQNYSLIGFDFEQTKQMFDLTEAELDMRILSCYAGGSSFTSIMTKQSKKAVACDPSYQLSKKELKAAIADALARLQADVHYHAQHYNTDINAKIAKQKKSIEIFLEDYESGVKELRYQDQALPTLDFEKKSFDLILLSHHLFTYSQDFTVQYHIETIQSLLRIADELRIYPLVTESDEISCYIGEVVLALQQQGLNVEIKAVNFEYQKKANAMLRVDAKSCAISRAHLISK